LPSVRRWANICAELLRPGGILYVREVHPMLLAITESDNDLVVTLPYFEQAAPERNDENESYGAPGETFQSTINYQWNHGLGETVQALLDANLTLELLREQRDAPWQAFGSMTLVEPGLYRLRADRRECLPCTFSLRARKPYSARSK